jgi:hypothetical protein
MRELRLILIHSRSMIHKALLDVLWNGVLQVDRCILPTWMAFLLTVMTKAFSIRSCTNNTLLFE